uniref:CASK interacting protein 1 n=1 Tax=Pelusios castaneus TaxID=367368 RepID=A0A8C8RZJ9_9SAUR
MLQCQIDLGASLLCVSAAPMGAGLWQAVGPAGRGLTPGGAGAAGSQGRVFQPLARFSALHHAALNGNTELISLLLEAQAAVDIKDNKGMRPLHYAAWQGKKEPMKAVLKAGSAVNAQSDEGQIPLHLAAQHGHYDVSEMLLQHQSNPCIVDISGKTPLDLACEFGRVGVVQLLLSSNMCTALLEPKPGDATDPNGTSPLHLAAKNGHIDIIRLLLQAGIDINRQTKAGTALHEAALCGKTDVVRLLLDSGINAHIRNTYSQTALDIVHQFTATQASKEIKQMLRDASAALQVRAVKDYCNNYDLTSLNVKAGDIITVLEQHADGRWKGCIHDNRTGNDRVGYFPSSLVEAVSKRTGKYPTRRTSGPAVARHGVGLGLSRGAGIPMARGPTGVGLPRAGPIRSGQSAGSGGHALHAGSEGVKCLWARGVNTGQWRVCYPRYPLKWGRVGAKELFSLCLLPLQANLALWLSMIGLAQYYKVLVENGYENIDFITDITWEDLQEIGITKLGHQKKLMLAVKKLAEIQKAEYVKYESGTLKKKAPQSLDVLAIEPPPQDSAECQSPKMTTFQDSELSSELQVALTGPGEAPEGQEKQANHVAHVREGTGYRAPSSRHVHENSLSGRAKHISSSQELLGDGPKGPSATMSKSQELLTEEGKEAPPSTPKEVRPVRHGHPVKRASVPPVPGKPRQSFPPAAGRFTPPQTPTKPRPSSPQTLIVPHATAKVKPTPQLLQQVDRPLSPRSLPQSPMHRGFAYVMPQPVEGEGPAGHLPSPLVQAVPVLPVSVPVLCLPPPSGEAEEEPGRPKKRAHSLNRYAMSDSEQERDELLVPDAGPYATVQRRVGRSHSVRAPSGGDKNVNRSQSFAVRPKKKGPPPPPPKRSSSAISRTDMADDFTKEGEGEVPGGGGEEEEEALVQASSREQRRASDFGGSVDTGSAGSVKSIAAMLEMSSIGGGARALALQKPHVAGGKGPDGYYLHPGIAVHLASPEHSRVATVLATVKHKDAIGLDGEVVNRRRTISGPVTGLIAARLRAEPGAKGEAGDGLSSALRHGDLAKVEASATLKRRIRAKQSQQDNVKFILTESDTVKRRPKSKDKEQGLEPAPLSVYQNGTSTIKRRPASDMSGAESPPLPPPGPPAGDRQDGLEPVPQATGAEPKKPFKPPVSPKPVLTPQAQKVPGPPTPTSKKAPIPSPGSPGKRLPGPSAPPPPRPRRLPSPPKVHAALQSVSAGSTPTPSPARQLTTTIKPSSTPPSLCSSPAKPLSPGGQPPQVPVKPPRSSLAGPSTESASPEAAHQKLEETSASLAAALQAVEEKIKQEDGQASKSTVSILDDIGSMFDDLADQLDAMLE